MTANLFEGENQQEIFQLRDFLDSNDANKRKEAAKRVISLKRAGENVQSLFSSMMRNVKTTDLELKKLIYLYLVTYSIHEPEQAIMAVSAFTQDSQDYNPLIRALAVRTMCRIKLDTVAENLILPLKASLGDRDPYVRKTAAFGVSKLYEVIPEAVENAQLIPELQKLMSDGNPMVISNTLQSLIEINQMRTSPVFVLNPENIGSILNALSSSNEWCQSVLFDALSQYIPPSAEDAQYMIDRLQMFLKSSNPAVVIGAFRNIYHFMQLSDVDANMIFPQIIPPYITLISSSDPEIQYIVLRTLSLFVFQFPKALSKEIRVFFCKFNDPSYIKMQKLDIIVTICSPHTAQIVLDELNEYCNSVDVSFVRKTIRSIGQIAIKIQAAARRCVDILVGLVSQRASYAIEESIIVVCDILRKFPNIFSSIITTVCERLDIIQTPEAKSAAIWILGEYCSHIDKIDVLLDAYLDNFRDEQPLVQLQIISSIVKIYLYKPETNQDQLQYILNEATKSSIVPDVRNRAILYWKLLSGDLTLAKEMLIFSKSGIESQENRFDADVLDSMIQNMGSICGVLHVTFF